MQISLIWVFSSRTLFGNIVFSGFVLCVSYECIIIWLKGFLTVGYHAVISVKDFTKKASSHSVVSDSGPRTVAQLLYMGISRQVYRRDCHALPPGDLSKPGLNLGSHIADRFFPSEPQGKSFVISIFIVNCWRSYYQCK